jgi:hypothetical protein
MTFDEAKKYLLSKGWRHDPPSETPVHRWVDGESLRPPERVLAVAGQVDEHTGRRSPDVYQMRFPARATPLIMADALTLQQERDAGKEKQ